MKARIQRLFKQIEMLSEQRDHYKKGMNVYKEAMYFYKEKYLKILSLTPTAKRIESEEFGSDVAIITVINCNESHQNNNKHDIQPSEQIQMNTILQNDDQNTNNIDIESIERETESSDESSSHSDILSHLNNEEIETHAIITATDDSNDDDIDTEMQNEKPFVCEICRKAFAYRYHLMRHKRTHTGEKPFACDICGEKFSRSSTVKRHKKRHTGEKPFACDICGKHFSESSNVKRHKRIHTGEKPFVCEICQKAFRDRSNLNKHKRIHSGEKPYACIRCGKTFRLSHNRNKHQRKHCKK